MRLFSILLFFIYTWGLGYSVTRFIRERSLEIFFMRIGIGLGAFPIIGVLLNLVRIPLDWKIFLLLSIAIPLYDLFKFKDKRKLKFKKPDTKVLLVLLIFILTLFLYARGTFINPWLEDDDSWLHAAAVKYVAIEKDVNDPAGVLTYINPYPPGYDLILGILHQRTPSIYWTIKFFNALIISLGILFFFFFAKEFIKDDDKALFSTFAFACIPCYLSHFIWSHALVVTLFFPAFYCVLKAIKDRRFFLSAILVIAGIMVVQPSQALKFVVMLSLLFFVFSIIYKKFQFNILLILFGAGLCSLLWWLPVIVRYALGSKVLFHYPAGVFYHKSHEITGLMDFLNLIKMIFDPSIWPGTVERVYTLFEFIFPPISNRIDNPIGIGQVLFILSLLGIYLGFRNLRKRTKDENAFNFTTLAWFIFIFLGINANAFHLPIRLFSYRYWMLLAIVIALMVSEAFIFIIRRFTLKKVKIAIAFIIIAGVLLTSGYPKYRLNNGRWPIGMHWVSHQEIEGYSWLREKLEPNTKVFSFIDNFFVIGFDMYCDFWKIETINFYKYAIELDIEGLHFWLEKHDYRYLIVGQREVNAFGVEKIIKKIYELNESQFFDLAHNSNDKVFIFKLM